MKKWLEKILAGLARAILRKYQPKIVGITGSIGKTSAKEAIFAVLKNRFNARQNLKNYNNELGLPLTIIGEESGGRSLIHWLLVFLKALRLILFRDSNYPRVLVLEMGADKPGDIDYLLEIAPCDIGVITKIGPTHLEAFKTIDNIVKEKRRLIEGLSKEGYAILNDDDPLTRSMAERTKAQVIFFGSSEAAQVRFIDLTEQGQGLRIEGIKFKINYGGSTVPVFLPGVVGAHQIDCALIAAAVGLALGLNLIEVAEGLKNYKSPRGRVNLILGQKDSLIIDDTYNSSPAAASAAVESVARLRLAGNNRKIAVLGDMLELGDLTAEAHIDLGRKVAEMGFARLVAVGQFREFVVQGAQEKGLQDILQYENSQQAAKELPELLQPGDLILVKGSQGARMERIVKALMLNPEKAGELLVRQGKEWQ